MAIRVPRVLQSSKQILRQAKLFSSSSSSSNLIFAAVFLCFQHKLHFFFDLLHFNLVYLLLTLNYERSMRLLLILDSKTPDYIRFFSWSEVWSDYGKLAAAELRRAIFRRRIGHSGRVFEQGQYVMSLIYLRIINFQ